MARGRRRRESRELITAVSLPIQFTSALWVGITVLCLGYVLLAVAVISDDIQPAERAIQIA
jgi:hypothetical protein